MEYCFWPGAYNFKNEIAMFLKFIREQIDSILKKIEKIDNIV